MIEPADQRRRRLEDEVEEELQVELELRVLRPPAACQVSRAGSRQQRGVEGVTGLSPPRSGSDRLRAAAAT